MVVARCLSRSLGLTTGAFYTVETREVGFFERLWSKLHREDTGSIELRVKRWGRKYYYDHDMQVLEDWQPVNQADWKRKK